MKTRPRFTVLLFVVISSVSLVAAQGTAPPPAGINPPVLKVNDDTVYAAEISMVMHNITGQLKAQGREMPSDDALVQMATQRVVEQKLLAQEARRSGYQPNDLRVAEHMKDLEQQAGGRGALEASLETSGSSREQLLNTVREMDLARTLIEKQIGPGIQVSDDEVAEFYEQNKAGFELPERVHARHIVFAVDPEAGPEAVAEAHSKAESARLRALAGEDFAELARELSEGPSAEKGGDLGFVIADQMVPEFAEAAFALEPGEISDVVRSEFGFHVITIEAKEPARPLSLEEASDQIRLLLTQRKTAAKVQEKIRALGEAATITPLVGQEPAAAVGGQGPPQ